MNHSSLMKSSNKDIGSAMKSLAKVPKSEPDRLINEYMRSDLNEKLLLLFGRLINW